MPNHDYFKQTFDSLATDGSIGDPSGKLAFAYIRVSDSDQAEDGHSGLPRQITHVHEAARKQGFKIPWDLVFADDCSGFEFENRPALSRLRQEYKSPSPRAQAVVIEHLDRLSRNADWHQGFLLDEMKRSGIEAVFWSAFGSLIERSVMGAMAQQGMEQSKRRMMEGNLHKARTGRVTARTPAYGYKLVDADGSEGPAARRESYYAIRDDEAAVVRLIFDRVIKGDPMRKIATDLDKAGIAPPKQYQNWEATQIRLFIKNEVYKGDYYAHRWKHTTVEKLANDGFTTRTVKNKVEYPREEWIHVPVPSIVSREEWEAANRMIQKNRQTSRRNAKVPYLLTGLVKCAYCGWTYTGVTSRNSRGKPRKTVYRGYRCPNHGVRPKHLAERHNCYNSDIPCDLLDNIVWKIVSQTLLEPEVLLTALDNDAASEHNRDLLQQIASLEKEIERRAGDDEKLIRAYLAGAFNEHEFAAQRQAAKNENSRMVEELVRMRAEVLTPEEIDQRKAEVLAISGQYAEEGLLIDPPFELKQRIIKLIVDEIVLNVSEGWLTLNGTIRGRFPIENTREYTDSSLRPAGNWPERSGCLWRG